MKVANPEDTRALAGADARRKGTGGDVVPRIVTVPRVVFALFFAVYGFSRRQLTDFGVATGAPTDIAPSPVVVFDFGVVLVLLAIVMFMHLGRHLHPAYGGAIVIIAVLFATHEWAQTTEVAAGIASIAMGILAWMVGGAFMAGEMRRPDPFGFIAMISAVFVAGQLYVSILQTFGRVDVGTLMAGGQVLTRVSGSFGHPGNLGKVIFLILLLLLPATLSVLRRTRYVAYGTLVAIIVIVGLSYSRATFAAVAVTLLAWLIVAPGQRVTSRVITIVIFGLLSLPFVDALLARFNEDPDGGLRPWLWDAAMVQLTLTPLFGVGPNAFIDVVGTWDVAVGSGYPVHNAFVLLICELGVICAVLIMYPQIAALVSAVRDFSRGIRTLGGSALIAAAPGLFIIGWTGWGLASVVYFAFWFLVVGMLVSAMRVERDALRDGGDSATPSSKKLAARR